MRIWLPGILALMAVVATTSQQARPAGAGPPAMLQFADATGTYTTASTAGSFDFKNPFFQVLGANGRACVSCHDPRAGWTITPPLLQARFNATAGTDPVFRTNDGSVCPSADASTLEQRRSAYRLLLSKGLIRVGLPVPAGAEFGLVSVDDPYGCSVPEISVYRRPPPATNLKFLSTVMWDGRESPAGRSLQDNLTSQARGATLGHAQAETPPSDAQLSAIVAFETATFTVQSRDAAAGELSAAQSDAGDPLKLAAQNFFIGINDPLQQNPSGAAFNPEVFTLFTKWSDFKNAADPSVTAARQAVARGEQIFNGRQFQITGVAGLNDRLNRKSITGTCTVCHDAPNAGNHSVQLALNIGISDASRRTPDLPLYTFVCFATNTLVRTTDPGRALITGKCEDLGKVKGPVLRNLAARAPYFHNGSAATLEDALEFYDGRFQIGFTAQEKSDLIAFLKTL
jgi:cytochrome c peroxidase